MPNSTKERQLTIKLLSDNRCHILWLTSNYIMSYWNTLMYVPALLKFSNFSILLLAQPELRKIKPKNCSKNFICILSLETGLWYPGDCCKQKINHSKVNHLTWRCHAEGDSSSNVMKVYCGDQWIRGQSLASILSTVPKSPESPILV